MNAVELKKDLIHRLDLVDNTKLEAVYSKIVDLINPETTYVLSDEENAAIDTALEPENSKKHYFSEEIKKEARKKYPKLKF